MSDNQSNNTQNNSPEKPGWELKYLLDQLKTNPIFAIPLAVIVIIIIMAVVLGDMLFGQF